MYIYSFPALYSLLVLSKPRLLNRNVDPGRTYTFLHILPPFSGSSRLPNLTAEYPAAHFTHYTTV